VLKGKSFPRQEFKMKETYREAAGGATRGRVEFFFSNAKPNEKR